MWLTGPQESTFLLLFKLEAGPWGEYQNILIMFYRQRASLLCKILRIHDKSLKAMAEKYHIYKFMKLKWLLITTCTYPIQFSHLSANIVITNWLYRLLTMSECECANSSLERDEPLSGPVGSLWVLPPIWPGQIPLLYPRDDISKNHLSSLCSFRGDRCKSFPVFFRLVFY